MPGLSAKLLNVIIAELQQDHSLLQFKTGKLSYIIKWKRLTEKLNTLSTNEAVKDVSEWQNEFRKWRKKTVKKASTKQRLKGPEKKFITMLEASKGKLTIGGIEIDNVADLYSSDDENTEASSSGVLDPMHVNHSESSSRQMIANDIGADQAKKINLLIAEKQSEICERMEVLEKPRDPEYAARTARFLEHMTRLIERREQLKVREVNAMEQRNELLRETIEILKNRPDAITCFIHRRNHQETGD